MKIRKITIHNTSIQKNRLIALSLLLFWIVFGNGMLLASYSTLSAHPNTGIWSDQGSVTKDEPHQSGKLESSCILCEVADHSETDEESEDEDESTDHLFMSLKYYFLVTFRVDSWNESRTCNAFFSPCIGALYILHHAWKSHLN